MYLNDVNQIKMSLTSQISVLGTGYNCKYISRPPNI